MAVSQAIYDVVVGAAGHKTTLSDAKDVLRDNSTMFVKAETYSEGGVVAFPQENIEIFVEPKAIIDDGLTFEAPGVHLHFGKGVQVQGKMTFEEQYATFLMNGGCLLEEVEFQEDFWFIDGGGWDTILSDRLYLNNADYGIARRLSVDTKTGGTGNHAVEITSDEATIEKVLVRNSDEHAFYTYTLGVAQTCMFIGNVSLQSDGHGMLLRGAIPIVLLNRIYGAGQAGSGHGISGSASVVYVPCFGNKVKDQASSGISMPAGALDWAVVGNRCEPGLTAAILDTPGGSTKAYNKETAY